MKRSFLVGGIILATIIGACAGWVAHGREQASASSPLRADISTLHYTNPLLLSASNESSSPELAPIAGQIRAYVDGPARDPSVSSVSVYFRNLNAGTWTGLNEDDTYKPSSMLKVVTMMAVLKLAENDPGMLKEVLPFTPDDSTRHYRPTDSPAAGRYTLSDLIYDMIVYSDNAANAALLADPRVNASFNEIYQLFRLPRNGTATDAMPDFMSAKSFSTVFRVLYNSTLFQWQLSEQVLDLLAKTEYKDGLVAGVPSGTVVAHKFGEAAYDGPNGTEVRELHDCGIVYYPNKPYFLCVMTKGTDESKLQPIIAHISQIVWNSVR